MKRQPAHRNRKKVQSGFIPSLEAAVKREMRRFNVSRSFVIATCVAFTLRIEKQPDYARLTNDVVDKFSRSSSSKMFQIRRVK